jgi:hypothetical protein
VEGGGRRRKEEGGGRRRKEEGGRERRTNLISFQKHGIRYSYSDNYFTAVCKYLKVVENASIDHAKNK